MDEPNSAPRDDSDAAASEGAAGHGSGPEQTPSPHPAARSGPEETPVPPEAVPRTTDEIFAEMVAGLQMPLTNDENLGIGSTQGGRSVNGPGPADEADDVDDADRTDGRAGKPGADGADDPDAVWSFPTAPWVHSGPRDRVVSPEVAELEELENRFIPPEPDMVLGRDPLVNLAWGVVILVPLGIIASMLFWPSAPAIVLQIAGLGFLASFGALVWRMPASRDPDENDPGAVV